MAKRRRSGRRGVGDERKVKKSKVTMKERPPRRQKKERQKPDGVRDSLTKDELLALVDITWGKETSRIYEKQWSEGSMRDDDEIIY